MKIKRVFKKNESAVDALKAPEYARKAQGLRRAYLEFESKVRDAGYKLVIDGSGDFLLTAIPQDIDLYALSPEEITNVLEQSYALGNDLITIV